MNNKKPLNIALLTLSDSRTPETDTSGDLLHSMLCADGHHLADRAILPDNTYQIRARVSQWIADDAVHVIITSGGTGLTGRDGTPEALLPLFDRQIDGFGELFRMISYEHIKTSMLASRAIAGVANGTFIFCLPGSPGACKDAWQEILSHQLDSHHKPCNLAQLRSRLTER